MEKSCLVLLLTGSVAALPVLAEPKGVKHHAVAQFADTEAGDLEAEIDACLFGRLAPYAVKDRKNYKVRVF